MKVTFFICIFLVFSIKSQVLPSGNCTVTFSLNKSKSLNKQLDTEDTSSYIETLDRMFREFDVVGAYITFNPDSLGVSYIVDYLTKNATATYTSESMRFNVVDIDDIVLEYSFRNYAFYSINVRILVKSFSFYAGVNVDFLQDNEGINTFTENVEKHFQDDEIIQIRQVLTNSPDPFDPPKVIEDVEFERFNAAISDKVKNCKQRSWIITDVDQYTLFKKIRSESAIVEKLAEAIDSKYLQVYQYDDGNIFEDFGGGVMRLYEPFDRKNLFIEGHGSLIALSDSMGERLSYINEWGMENDYTGTFVDLQIGNEKFTELEIVEFSKPNKENEVYVRIGFDTFFYPDLSFFVNLKDIKKIFGEKSLIVHTILNCQQFGLQYAQEN
jgi:hypothetical protein